MTLFQDVIAGTRLYLMTSAGELITQLQSGINSSVTSLTLKFDARQISEGTILGVDLEEMYVLSKSATVVSVIRGWNGSIAVAHDADDVIRTNAKFTDYRIGRYVNQVLEDLSAEGLFQMKPYEFTYQPARARYEIVAPDMIDVWRVRYDSPGPGRWWTDMDKCEWEVDQNANPTDFPSGKSILLQMPAFPGHTVRLSYKASFTPLTSTTDDVFGVSGLHSEAHDLLSLGAAINALGGREVKRTFLDRQPEPRRSEEVPVGGASQAMRPIVQMYMDGLRRERRRLRRRYPDQVY